MTITGQKVTEELFAEARRHFSEAQMVELAAAVALGVEGQGFCLLK